MKCAQYVLAAGYFMRLRGLIGRERAWEGACRCMVFAPCGSVHTFLMRAPLDIAFADARGRVLDVRRAVPPNRLVRCRRARIVVERLTPTENPQSAWLNAGDALPFALIA